MRYLVVEVVGCSVSGVVSITRVLVIGVPVERLLRGVQLVAVLGGVLLSLGL
jgi:hypothetical protein